MTQTLYTIRQGDVRPRLRVRLKDDLGQVLNLNGATVAFEMADRDGNLLLTKVPEVVGDAANGIVEPVWEVADFATREPVDYLGYFTVELPGGEPMSLPNGEEIIVRVRKKFQ